MYEKDLKIVDKFKSLVAQRVNILEIRVFGSRVRGDATEASDLDILLVVDRLERKGGQSPFPYSTVVKGA